MGSTLEPPYYVLVSQSSLHSSSPGPVSSTLGHPVVEYHYTDDSPLFLLPQSPDEHVIILNHNTAPDTSPTVRSISHSFAVGNFKVSDAPGAGADTEESSGNDKMYVLDVISTSDQKSMLESSNGSLQNPQAALAKFKQRNTVLRRVLNEHNI